MYLGAGWHKQNTSPVTQAVRLIPVVTFVAESACLPVHRARRRRFSISMCVCACLSIIQPSNDLCCASTRSKRARSVVHRQVGALGGRCHSFKHFHTRIQHEQLGVDED
jgi:hypothetical protein